MSHTIAQTRKGEPMWVYEKNYVFLMQLLPDLYDDLTLSWQLTSDTMPSGLTVQVLENSRYTQMVELSQSFPGNPLLSEIRMSLRVYHDARLVEVIAYQTEDRLKAPYESHENSVQRKGDKQQVNLLLHDWLGTYINAERNNALRTQCVF